MIASLAVLYFFSLNLAIFLPQTGAEQRRKGDFAERTVELGIFIDQYLYHHWLSILRSPPSIRYFIRLYLDVLVQSLNLIYAHPSLGEVPIGFHLAHTQIFWRRGGELEDGDDVASLYLETFCRFANKENWSGTRWDHALLLTGVGLKAVMKPHRRNYTVAGISWDNSMCNSTYSCSVVDGRTFRSVITTAHELGHSLGIEHDGLKYNFKCPPRGFIMSHAGGVSEDDDFPTAKIAWSACSKHNLKAFLVTAPSVLNNQAKCLNNKPRKKPMRFYYHHPMSNYSRQVRGFGGERQRDSEFDERLPGFQFSVKEQCQLGGGLAWLPTTSTTNNQKICSMLYCVNNVTKHVEPFHPALEGSSCGQARICHYGECLLAKRVLLRHKLSQLRHAD